MSLPYPFAFRLHSSLRVGPLAQLVEQLTLNQRVRSSSLRRPTILFNSCLVTAQTHGYFFRDSGTDHVSDCASAAIMHQEATINFLGGPGFGDLLESSPSRPSYAGIASRLAKIADPLSVCMKDKSTVRSPGLP